MDMVDPPDVRVFCAMLSLVQISRCDTALHLLRATLLRVMGGEQKVRLVPQLPLF